MFDISPVSENNIYRRRRIMRLNSMIQRCVSEKGACRLLDLGGTLGFWHVWRNHVHSEGLSVTCVNLHRDNTPTETGFPLEMREGDACSLSEFEDNTFDVVFSNSAIEHVGLWPNKVAFAQEARRLAPNYLIQTPNFWFPIEPHARAPFLHWLPRPVAYRIHLAMDLGFYPKARSQDEAMSWAEDAAMLDKRQMQSLFPDGEILTERFMLLGKSLIALRHQQ